MQVRTYDRELLGTCEGFADAFFYDGMLPVSYVSTPVVLFISLAHDG